MSQITIKVSAKAEAMIAQLQKEIFNRRRKKITAQGVVESLVESGAKSQSDKRYASSWKNLIKDIEKAAKQSEAHGNKPANVSAEEWAMLLAHRTRKGTVTRKAAHKKRLAKKPAAKNTADKRSPAKKIKVLAKKTTPVTTTKPKKARRAKKTPVKTTAKLA